MVKLTVTAPDEYKMIEPMIYESGKVLGFFDTNNDISQWLQNKLFKKDDGSVWLEPFWPTDICGSSGFNKKEFVNFQVLIYSAKELYDDGIIKIDVEWEGEKMVPCIGKNKSRKSDNIIKDIKRAKNVWNTIKHMENNRLFSKCTTRKIELPKEYIKICCVCFSKPIRILKKDLTF